MQILRMLAIALTFLVIAFSVMLFAYTGLIFIGFSGISAPWPLGLSRTGFFVIPITLGIIAGILAAFSTARMTSHSRYADDTGRAPR